MEDAMEEVVLKIPFERNDAKEWIITQPPGVVADIFDVAKELFKFTSSMASVQASSKAQDIARIAQQHLKSISEKDNVISDLNTELQQLNLTMHSKAVELSKIQMKNNEEIHNTQVQELMKRQEDMLSNSQQHMKSYYDNIMKRYEEEIDRLKQEMNTIKLSEKSTNSHMFIIKNLFPFCALAIPFSCSFFGTLAKLVPFLCTYKLIDNDGDQYF